MPSILSNAPSVTTSVSYAESLPESAFADLKRLLLFHDELATLYPIALYRVGPERLGRNLGRLFMQYGQSLYEEALEPVQKQAAKYVRHSSTRLAAEIKEAILVSSSGKWSTYPDETQSLNEDLEDLRPVDATEMSNNDEESPDNHGLETIPALESVEDFMVSAQAFMKLRDEFTRWLQLDTGPNDSPAKEKSQVGEASTRDSTWLDWIIQRWNKLYISAGTMQPAVPSGVCSCIMGMCKSRRGPGGLAFLVKTELTLIEMWEATVPHSPRVPSSVRGRVRPASKWTCESRQCPHREF